MILRRDEKTAHRVERIAKTKVMILMSLPMNMIFESNRNLKSVGYGKECKKEP